MRSVVVLKVKEPPSASKSSVKRGVPLYPRAMVRVTSTSPLISNSTVWSSSMSVWTVGSRLGLEERTA